MQVQIRLVEQIPFEGHICKACVARKPLEIMSDGGFARDFCGVDLLKLNPGEANADNRYWP
jgi:hypothetical protein